MRIRVLEKQSLCVSNRASGFDAAKKATTKGWKQNMEAFGVGNIDYLDQKEIISLIDLGHETTFLLNQKIYLYL